MRRRPHAGCATVRHGRSASMSAASTARRGCSGCDKWRSAETCRSLIPVRRSDHQPNPARRRDRRARRRPVRCRSGVWRDGSCLHRARRRSAYCPSLRAFRARSAECGCRADAARSSARRECRQRPADSNRAARRAGSAALLHPTASVRRGRVRDSRGPPLRETLGASEFPPARHARSRLRDRSAPSR